MRDAAPRRSLRFVPLLLAGVASFVSARDVNAANCCQQKPTTCFTDPNKAACDDVDGVFHQRLTCMGNGRCAKGPGDQGTEDAADLQFSKQTKLSAQEQLTQSAEYRVQMGNTLKHILTLQDKAQKEKDVIKLNCLNDKIAQVRGHIAVTDESITTLKNAINDEGARNHEFTRITILSQKVQVLGTEAENCIGEDITFVGNQQVDVEIDPNIPVLDPTAIPVPGLEPIPRPTEASPTT